MATSKYPPPLWYPIEQRAPRVGEGFISTAETATSCAVMSVVCDEFASGNILVNQSGRSDMLLARDSWFYGCFVGIMISIRFGLSPKT